MIGFPIVKVTRRVVENVSTRFRSSKVLYMSEEPKGSVDWWCDVTWNKGIMKWKGVEDDAWPFADNLKFCGISESQTTKMKVLIPLCGDTAAVPIFAGMGMDVTAVEGSETGRRDLAIRISDILKNDEDSKKRITILGGDFFKLMTEVPDNTFDLIYDRGSLVAINPDMRKQYVDIMNRVSKTSCHMFIEGMWRNSEYVGDVDLYPDHPNQVNLERGPPHHVTPNMIKELYPNWNYSLNEKSLAKVVSVPPEVPFGEYSSALVRRT